MRFVDDLNNLIFGFLDGGDNVGVSTGIGNGVTDTNAVTLEKQPVVDHGLDVAVKFAVFLKKNNNRKHLRILNTLRTYKSMITIRC